MFIKYFNRCSVFVQLCSLMFITFLALGVRAGHLPCDSKYDCTNDCRGCVDLYDTVCVKEVERIKRRGCWYELVRIDHHKRTYKTYDRNCGTFFYIYKR